ncbi:unnamed protein product [Lymnaea stagnalis]|uniref:Chondroitin sulfate proteoglycan 4 n=1 Tax=Lymnaea stagnalis TaxID=6523 RepID=A0AAV2IQU8_LYMST
MEYGSSEWVPVTSFSQRHINSGRLRYVHQPGKSISMQDSFKFDVICKHLKTPPHTFSLTLKTVTLSIEQNSNLILNHLSFGKFTNKTLMVVSNTEHLNMNNIIYLIVRPPQYGSLYLIKQNVQNLVIFEQFSPLQIDNTFTQNDINEGFVYYKFEKPGFEQTDDFADLQASYFGFPLMVRASVQYSPDKVAPRFINNGLKDVPEGSSAVITKQDLSLDLEKYKKFMFSIIRGPAHGTVNVRDPNSSAILRKNVSFFTMSDIKEGKVVYTHDDSENQKDSFTFSANPVLEESKGNVNEFQEFTGVFHIMMKMKNDNPPVRTVNKVFHVAVGQIKYLTTADLAFTDPDKDFDDSLLTYQRQSISNGDILNSVTEEPVYNFSQSDLAKGVLMFHHKGDMYARVSISVSDGKFLTTSLFEIQASPPYLLIVNNTGVEVLQGSHITINSFNLSIESNLNVNPEEVTFQVTEEPKHGLLRINGRQVLKFTYLELLNSRVRYWHSNGAATEDKLTLTVNLESVQTQVAFRIKIVAEGLSDPPEIIHNQILKVQALQSEAITEHLLKVAHKNYPPNEIEFIITQLPRFGHLMIKGIPVKTGNVPEFTQQDIADRLISYVSQSQDSISDKFVFDVGTEFQSLRQLEFLIENIPQTQQVNRVNVTVAEGGTVTIASQLLPLRGRLAQNGKPVYSVLQAPVHGQIVLKNGKKEAQVSSFTLEDVTRGRVAYVHDGSESVSDEFVVKAEAPDAAVPPQQTVLKVSVTPVDDQPPRVVVNTGLDLWTGSLSLLTNQHLQASDPDSSSTLVEYRVLSPPSNGHLAFLNNTFKQISRFTQQDLDSQRIVFVHKGSEMGEFTFQATDGRSKDETHVFKLRARPVQLTLAVSGSIKAFPGVPQPITNMSLLAKTSSSNYTHPIVFTILEPRPRKGKLVSKANKQAEINSFTQFDINEGIIYFQPFSSIRNWSEKDQIFFEITAAYAQMLSNQTLKVDISYSNINEDNYQTLLNIKTPYIKEGDKIPISKDNFDSTDFVLKLQTFRAGVSVELSFMSSANHGYLWFKGRAAEVGEVFTQEDLDSGLLTYRHDNSDTLRDKFLFTVKIMIPRSSGELSNSTANTFRFDIFIEPINDMGFEMVTLHPRILVLQGSEVVVTSHALTTVDLDTGPEGIEYTILTQPKNGILVRSPENKTQVVTFTQKDIDDGRLIFKHDGSRESSGFLYFKVWDGMFQPHFSNMDINVTPLFIEVGKNAHVPVIQGSRSVKLSNVFLNVSTNGDYNALTYKITQAPQFGRLRMLNSPAREFRQAHIDGGAITYVQDKDSPGDDFFVCDIALHNIDCSIDTVQIDVVMKPLIKQGPLVTSKGLPVAITRSSLDASELVQITSDNPRFSISIPPKHGKIMRRHRQRRQAILENNFQPVSTFTFEDILYTKIYYVANGVNINDKTDNFTFWLSAKGVPSAKGELVIHLNDPVQRENDNVDKKPGKDEGKSHDEDEEKDIVTESDVGEKQPVLDSESDSDDNGNVVIIAIVLSLIFILCVIIVLVVLFLRWRRKNQAALVHETKATKIRPVISGPLQLEQPHVLIEAHQDGMISPNSRDSTALMVGQGEENEYVNTSHMSSTHEALHLLNGSSPGSPDITRVEINHATPGLKSTPTHDSQSEQASEEIERCSTVTSGRGSNASNDLMDWTLMDPDLLQHCRTTTPVLRNNQYWL